MIRLSSLVLFLLMAPLLLGGCGGPDTANGKIVYTQYCARCHSASISPAPQLDAPAQWQQRLAQGEELLAVRSIHGYSGPRGMMPGRGGNVQLSDESVRDAVAYMISQVQNH